MNKGLHRIIFSKKHSTMVAVAETANSQGKGKQAGSSVSVSLKTSGDLCGKLKTTLKTLVCSLVSLSMVLPAHAQITTDKSAPKNQQVVILKTNTGAPLVNIQTPNGRGLSHNRYTQFDVDNKGAVLNNDRNNNPFLVKGGAQLILNEVRGTASKLNGIVTVGGQKADVIIANPNGITVNGGGFKNVGRGILTTGAPQIGKDGALTGFDVRQGTLTVGAAGWNDKGGADYTEILARAVALQGKLQGKNLAVSTGPQKVDYASGEISAGTAAGTKPTIALDTAALGGMYADSITLIANEKGVGVKNAGTLEAAKQLIVTSSGRIENSGRIATTADSTEASPTYLSIETTETGAAGAFISNGGRIESKGLLVIDTGEDIGLRNGAVVQNNGNRPAATVLNAGRNLVIESKANVNNAKGSTNLSTGGRTVIKEASIQTGTTVYSSSKGNAELGNNTRITGADVTVLSNGTISSSAVIDAKDTAHIEAGKPLSLEASTVTSDIRLNGGSIKGGKQLALLADDNITAKTTNLNTPGNLYVHTGKDLNLNVDKDLSAASIHLKSDNAAHITGTSKTLTASKDMGVEAGSLNVTNTNLRTNSGNLHIQAAKGNIQLRNTKLNAAKALETTALQGNIVSDGLHAVSADGHVSLLANGNADFTGHNTLTAKADVNAGSVGKGRLKADNTNITSSSGDITLVAGNGIQLGDGKQRNSINGKHISIKNNGGNADLKNLNVHAKSGALNIHSDRALSIENTKLESTHNTHLNAQHERVTLNQVDAYAHRHLSITGSQIWQNDKLPSANKLVANGVLALNARYSQIADNTTLRAGAINLTAGTALVKRGNINWSTVSTKTLEDNAELKPLAGRLNIEAGSGTLTIEPANRISAHTDLSIKTGGKLLLSAKGGNAGAPSAQVSSLEAKGNIRLVTGETDLRGSKITAGKNLVVATTKGKLNIEAVNNSFSNYFPTQKAAELNQKSKELEQQIAQLKKSSPKSKLIPTLQEERDRLAFYIQAINKEVKGKKPKGKEYLQAKLSAQNIDLISAQGIEISGSDITASKKLNLHAAGVLPKAADSEAAAILIDGITDQYEIGKPTYKSHYDKAALNKPSRLTGRTGVSIHAAAALDDARIIIGASEIKAPSGSIDIKAHSDIVLEAGQNDAYTFLKTKGKSGKIIRKTKFTSTRDHLIMPAPVELTANGITLQAGGNIEANTTRFNAPAGKVTLVAGEELQLLAEEGIHKHELDVQKSRRFIGIKVGKSNYSKNELNETKLPVRVVAQTAATRSGWDTVLEGTEFKTTLAGADIQAGVGEKARADAKIILKGIVNRIQSEEKLETNSTVWQKQAGRGSTIETLKLPSFESPTPPKLTAPGGYIVDIPKGNLKTEIEKLAKQPEYAYLKQLQVAKNINWNQVQLAYDKWDYKQEGMTPAAAAVVVIVVTVLTYGALSAPAAAGTAGAAGAGAGGAAAGTAAGTGVAAGTAATTGVAAGTSAAAITTAAGKAALASLASQAAVSLINNKGDINHTLKELGKSSTVRQAATAAVTAGVLQGISGLNTQAAEAVSKHFHSPAAGKLTANLINSTAAASVHTAINGGSLKDNLGDAALGAIVSTVHGEVASKIKFNLSEDYIAHKIAHAIAGCAAAVANKGKCRDGAIGAAVGEILGETLLDGRDPGSLNVKDRAKIIAKAKLAAGAVAALSKGDVSTAANAAAVAVENNSLNDIQDRLLSGNYALCMSAGGAESFCESYRPLGLPHFVSVSGEMKLPNKFGNRMVNGKLIINTRNGNVYFSVGKIWSTVKSTKSNISGVSVGWVLNVSPNDYLKEASMNDFRNSNQNKAYAEMISQTLVGESVGGSLCLTRACFSVSSTISKSKSPFKDSKIIGEIGLGSGVAAGVEKTIYIGNIKDIDKFISANIKK
ncbi:filamentous hemagglutinin family N-terminal domain protein [Neisseria meningitidis 73696]|nr:filamentous hemagglutinin family N-terminal domain protein [Neisseria meningitidis 73696]